jgi:transposase-like protein
MVADIARKLGTAENTYYRWRQLHAPAQIDDTRKVRDRRTVAQG